MSTSVEKSTFSFVKYLITDAKINVSDKEISKKINFSFTPSGIIDKENKRFELKLQTEVSDKNKSFKIKLCAIGLFKYEGSIEDTMQFFCINGPAILFPYIRAYLSSLSALSGIPLIFLPKINMTGLAETLKSNIKITE